MLETCFQSHLKISLMQQNPLSTIGETMLTEVEFAKFGKKNIGKRTQLEYLIAVELQVLQFR